MRGAEAMDIVFNTEAKSGPVGQQVAASHESNRDDESGDRP